MNKRENLVDLLNKFIFKNNIVFLIKDYKYFKINIVDVIINKYSIILKNRELIAEYSGIVNELNLNTRIWSK